MTRLRLPRLNLRAPVLLTRLHVLTGGAIVGVALAATLLLVTVLVRTISDVQQDQINANRQSLTDQARLQALERPPTDRELATAALHALRVCGDDPACRSQFRTVIRRARVRRADVPALARALGQNARRPASTRATVTPAPSATANRGQSTPRRPARPPAPPPPPRPGPPTATIVPTPPVPLTPPLAPPPLSPLVPPVTVPVPVPAPQGNRGPGGGRDPGDHGGPGDRTLDDLGDELVGRLRDTLTTSLPSAIVQRRTRRRTVNPGAQQR